MVHQLIYTPLDAFGCLLIELFGRRRVWPGLDGPDIVVQIMGTYNTPPQMPDSSHLKAPFGTRNLNESMLDVQYVMNNNLLTVVSCKASQEWGSFENA